MCKRHVYLRCICIRWFDLERCSFLPANTPIPSRGLLGLISRLTSASRLCSELARSPEQALAESCNHVGAACRVRGLAKYTSMEHYLPEFRLPKSAHRGAKNETTPLQDTTQYVAHKSGSVPANRLRHSTNTECSFSSYLVCNVEYSHLPNSARTELLHEG